MLDGLAGRVANDPGITFASWDARRYSVAVYASTPRNIVCNPLSTIAEGLKFRLNKSQSLESFLQQ
jgi:hypothetical protein